MSNWAITVADRRHWALTVAEQHRRCTCMGQRCFERTVEEAIECIGERGLITGLADLSSHLTGLLARVTDLPRGEVLAVLRSEADG